MARRRLWIVIVIFVVLLGGAVYIYRSLNSDSTEEAQSSLIGDEYEIPSVGFSAVEEDYNWQFPEDYGVHLTFQREEWLLTTNENCQYSLNSSFRLINIVPPIVPFDRESEWAVESVMTAQITIHDDGNLIIDKIADSRIALDLAGADSDRVWIENWELNWTNGSLTISGIQDQLVLNLDLGAATVANTDEWYQYRRPTEIDGDFTYGDETATISCDATLTHRFGTS
jgi:predicted secreted hydrolase